MSTISRPIFVVAGVGNGTGTGAASARLFAKQGYNVALIARNPDHLRTMAGEINVDGGTAAAFPVEAYTPKDIHSAFDAIKKQWPDADIRVSLYNASFDIRKPFLDITPEEVQESVDLNIIASFAFARESILAFKALSPNKIGKRGTLLFTGATASQRGNTTTSAFAAGKFGLRALAQSLAKEFGKEDIHVAHSIIDGGIITDETKTHRNDTNWEQNEAVRLDPASIGKAYLYLVNQDRSAWTWELDLRPAHEKW